MAEPLAVLGALAASTQLLVQGVKAVAFLFDLRSKMKAAPTEVQEHTVHIEQLISLSVLFKDTPSLHVHIAPYLDVCLLRANTILVLVQKYTITANNGRFDKASKSFKMAWKDKDIIQMFSHLEKEKTSLTLAIQQVDSKLFNEISAQMTNFDAMLPDMSAQLVAINSTVAALPDIASEITAMNTISLPEIMSQVLAINTSVDVLPLMSSQLTDVHTTMIGTISGIFSQAEILPALSSQLADVHSATVGPIIEISSQVTAIDAKFEYLPTISAQISQIFTATIEEALPDLSTQITTIGSHVETLPAISSQLAEVHTVVLPGISSQLSDVYSTTSMIPMMSGQMNQLLAGVNDLQIAHSQPSLPPPQLTHYSVPRLVKGFIGREEMLKRIITSFSKSSEGRGPKIVTISGLGGQGKTQIALEYCRQAKAEGCKAIFWVDAMSVLASFKKIANLIKNPGEAVTDEQAKNFCTREIGRMAFAMASCV